jgi:hypothetical protein
MPSDILRSRDCVVFFKGDAYTVAVDPAMVASGWPGGQGVMWAASAVDDRVVTYSNGLYGGFLVWGSDESGDRYTSMTGQSKAYRYATFISGGALLSTTTYERYTYTSRLGVGPYAPLVYKPNDILYLSLRGYWTVEDELTLSGNPLAPAFFAGFVAQVPKATNNYFLGVQTSM